MDEIPKPNFAHLSGLATAMRTSCPALSAYYNSLVSELTAISRRPYPTELRSQICQSCGENLIPGVTCNVSVKSAREVLLQARSGQSPEQPLSDAARRASPADASADHDGLYQSGLRPPATSTVDLVTSTMVSQERPLYQRSPPMLIYTDALRAKVSDNRLLLINQAKSSASGSTPKRQSPWLLVKKFNVFQCRRCAAKTCVPCVFKQRQKPIRNRNLTEANQSTQAYLAQMDVTVPPTSSSSWKAPTDLPFHPEANPDPTLAKETKRSGKSTQKEAMLAEKTAASEDDMPESEEQAKLKWHEEVRTKKAEYKETLRQLETGTLPEAEKAKRIAEVKDKWGAQMAELSALRREIKASKRADKGERPEKVRVKKARVGKDKAKAKTKGIIASTPPVVTASTTNDLHSMFKKAVTGRQRPQQSGAPNSLADFLKSL
ncbi:hypothetical protein H4R33_002575 [Dimargaris cristalligena]|uniref:Uncharacterized protein n=1 Tax=Dimargaris cristalligena TaxID=215637 RepID=A0A4Q0A1D3_9FUNG|nr:hypothetical protein H4R33_002575 [Dimargaris cristalligena]RKP39578.1 hypothetical protein BJ085DRAFT_32728 [Dimargaris cristalligena]|eukprot:RKP39578.1 hypothetical protein BJ085DRAFT_32728 [Dimargaris cristalligena]